MSFGAVRSAAGACIPASLGVMPSTTEAVPGWGTSSRLRATTSSRPSGMGAGGPPKTAASLGELRIRTRTALLGLEDRDLTTQAQWGVQGLVNPRAAPDPPVAPGSTWDEHNTQSTSKAGTVNSPLVQCTGLRCLHTLTPEAEPAVSTRCGARRKHQLLYEGRTSRELC